MPETPDTPSTDEMIRLYTKEQWDVQRIADHLGVSYGLVYGRLLQRVVMRRGNPGARPSRGPDAMTPTEIVEAVCKRIADGDWKPGDKIGPPVLANTFGVRQQTARAAITILKEHNYVRTQPGKGTFVCPAQDWREQNTES